MYRARAGPDPVAQVAQESLTEIRGGAALVLLATLYPGVWATCAARVIPRRSRYFFGKDGGPMTPFPDNGPGLLLKTRAASLTARRSAARCIASCFFSAACA